MIDGSKHGRGTAHQITGPDKVISAVVRITPCFSPRNRERSNQGTRIRLVFMAEKQAEAAVVKAAVVTRKFFQRKPVRGGTVPLLRVALQVFFERNAKRLKEGRYRTVLRVTERQSRGELALANEVNFPHQGNVS